MKGCLVNRFKKLLKVESLIIAKSLVSRSNSYDAGVHGLFPGSVLASFNG